MVQKTGVCVKLGSQIDRGKNQLIESERNFTIFVRIEPFENTTNESQMSTNMQVLFEIDS
jgi:hypothetical protein